MEGKGLYYSNNACGTFFDENNDVIQDDGEEQEGEEQEGEEEEGDDEEEADEEDRPRGNNIDISIDFNVDA